MPTIHPSDTFTVTGPTGTVDFCAGIFAGANHWSVEDSISDLVQFTQSLLTEVGSDRALPPAPAVDRDDNLDDWTYVSDGCEAILNDLLPVGWYVELCDNEWYFCQSERPTFDVTPTDPGPFFEANGDEVAPMSEPETLYVVEVAMHDPDFPADPDPLGTFAAIYHGGPYLNIYGFYSEDASDFYAHLQPNVPIVGNPCEALYVNDEDRTRSGVLSRLTSWLQDYADAYDGSDWFHDAPHYGLPS